MECTIESLPTESTQSNLQILHDNQTNLDTIKSVKLITQKDHSFSRVRSATVTANALGFALKVPVNNKKFVTTEYYKKPNITRKA